MGHDITEDLGFTGLVPSEPDKRDYGSSDCIVGLGAEPTPDSYFLPVYRIHNQKPVKRCAAEAATEWTEYNEAVHFGITVGMESKHSAGFVYQNRDITERGGSVKHYWRKPGMIIEEMLRSLLKDGVCLSATWPWSQEYRNGQAIPQAAYDDAKLRALDSYFQIYDGWDEIKETMVALKRYVLAVIPFYDYMVGGTPGVVRKPTSGDKMIGYHAVNIIEYTPDIFTTTTHYAPGWGDSGLMHLERDFPVYKAFGLVDNNCPLSTKPEAKTRGITMYFKDEPLFCSVDPIISNSHLLLPMRFVFDTLGATVEWDAERGEAVARKVLKTVRVKPGEDHAVIITDGAAKMVELEAPAEAISNRIYIPLRFAAEAFGYKAQWIGPYKEARIY